MKYLRSFFIFIFLLSAYGGIAIFSSERCKNTNALSNNIKNTCKTFDQFLYPAQLFNEGLWEFIKLVRIKLFTGEFLTTGLTSNEDTRERFKDLNSGFNFYYQPGEKKKAGYLLLSRSLPEENGNSSIEIWDLKKQNQIHSYKIELEEIRKNFDIGSQPQLRHPVLLKDGSIIVTVVGGINPIIKLDKCGKYISGNNTEKFHHSLELDKNNRIYSPIYLKSNSDFSKIGHGFVIIDKNLNIIKKFSLEEIFIENYLANDIDRPAHLNDVEPFISDDGNYLILLSLRNQHRILAFDPDENKIIWIIDNAFSLQHDVDIISEEESTIDISVFDNNRYKSVRKSHPYPEYSNNFHNLSITFKDLPIKTDRILHLSTKEEHIKYGYSYNDFSFLEKKYRPKTPTQGLSDFIKENNSLMIEDSDNGYLFEVDTIEKKFLWQYVNKENGEKKINYQLNWSRRLNNLPKGLDIKIFKKCNI